MIGRTLSVTLAECHQKAMVISEAFQAGSAECSGSLGTSSQPFLAVETSTCSLCLSGHANRAHCYPTPSQTTLQERQRLYRVC